MPKDRIWNEARDYYLIADNLNIAINEYFGKQKFVPIESLSENHNAETAVLQEKTYAVVGEEKFTKRPFVLKSGFMAKLLAEKWIKENF
jgi:hypothetical protein